MLHNDDEDHGDHLDIHPDMKLATIRNIPDPNR